METSPYIDLREVSWTGEVLTKDESHAHLAIDELSELSSEVASNLIAARSSLEREYGVLLREEVNFVYLMDSWPATGEQCYLPVAPVQSVEIIYLPVVGTAQTLTIANYDLNLPTYGRPSLVFKGTMPLLLPGSKITVSVVAGWGVGKVPHIGKQAVRLMLTELFDESEDPRQRELLRNRAGNLMQNLTSGILL